MVLALFLVSVRALADERDPAAAQALFDEAQKLTSAGRYAEACPKLAESNRLDPGIGTQFHLADCYEQTGRLATGWAIFLEVASLARASGQSDREKAAIKRAARLEPRLPKLEVTVPEASRVPGLEIRRDGILMGAAQWSTAVPVDPGEHELVASAPGRRTLSQTFRTEPGKRVSLELPLLIAETAAAAEPTAAPQTFTPQASASGSERPESSTAAPVDEGAARGGPSPWVYGLAGVGVVGVGLGATFALMASSANDDSKAECRPDDPNVCGARGVELRDDAMAKGNVATVAFIVGGAALAGAGVWLLVSSGSSEKAATGALAAGVASAPGGVALHILGGF